jgi:hypothetical protein
MSDTTHNDLMMRQLDEAETDFASFAFTCSNFNFEDHPDLKLKLQREYNNLLQTVNTLYVQLGIVRGDYRVRRK